MYPVIRRSQAFGTMLTGHHKASTCPETGFFCVVVGQVIAREVVWAERVITLTPMARYVAHRVLGTAYGQMIILVRSSDIFDLSTIFIAYFF